MIKIGIRLKFVFFTSLLIATLGIASSWFFSVHTRKQLEEELKKRGYSLIAQLAQDGEAKDSMSVAQKTFFDEPIRRLRNLDIEQELAYWRVLLAHDNILLEEKEEWIKTEIDKIPVHKNIESITGPVFNVYINGNGEQFYNFVVPIYEKHTIAEEELASQFFDLDEDNDQNEEKLLGIIQIGLTPERINKKMQMILWSSIIPLGFVIILVGTGVSYFIASGVVKPVEQLVKTTDKVASGDLDQKVTISSRDEIGLLASQFNQMTKSLKQLIDEKEGVMEKLKNSNKKLSSINIELVQKNEQLNEAHEQLVTYQTQLKQLSSILLLTEERERRQIADDLHGSLGQTLTVMKIKLDELKDPHVNTDSDRTLEEIKELLDNTIQSFRTLLFEISPPILYELGFEPAVEWLIEQFREQHNIPIEYESNGNGSMLNNDVSFFLFKSVRELLFNIVKHAKAHRIKVFVQEEKNRIGVNIEDDGVGFDTSKVKLLESKLSGFGLFSIYERMESFGGSFDVESKLGQGTRITLAMSLEQQKGDRGAK